MTTIDGPLGATLTKEGVHFRVFSSIAERIELCLFDDTGGETRYELVLEPGFIWHLFVMAGSVCHFFAVLGHAGAAG